MQWLRGFLVAEVEGADGVADVGSRESRLAVRVNGEASLALAVPRLGGELEDEVELGCTSEYYGNVRTRNSCTSHACRKTNRGTTHGIEK
jgi:hypothetical protein